MTHLWWDEENFHRGRTDRLRELQGLAKQMETLSIVADKFGTTMSAKIEKELGRRQLRNDAELSWAMQKDSAAMKAIAVLTMVFLPGSFVAVRPSP